MIFFQATIILAFAAIAFADLQSAPNPQNITQVVSGVPQLGVLLPSDVEDVYDLDFYKFYVPEYVGGVQLSFSQTGASGRCSYLSLLLSTYSVPCSNRAFPSSNPVYHCSKVYDIGGGTNDQDLILDMNDRSDFFNFETERYWYIGVGKWSSSDNTKTCTYSLELSFVEDSNCSTNNEVSVVTSSYNPTYQCEAYTQVNFTGSEVRTFSLDDVNPGTDKYNVFKLNIPTASIGHIFVRANVSVNNLNIIGNNFAVPSNVGYSDCRITSFGAFEPSKWYVYEGYCYTPRQGAYYMNFVTDRTNWDAHSIEFNLLPCADGLGGFNCTSTLYKFNATELETPQTFNIPFTTSSPTLAQNSVLFYWDIPSGFDIQPYSVILKATSTDVGYLMTRRDGFPSADQNTGYEDGSQVISYALTYPVFGFNRYEFGMPGRIYLGLSCNDADGCTVILSGNSSVPIVTQPPAPTPPPVEDGDDDDGDTSTSGTFPPVDGDDDDGQTDNTPPPVEDDDNDDDEADMSGAACLYSFAAVASLSVAVLLF